MKFKVIIFFFILVVCYSSFSIEIKELELLLEISNGNKEGQCGWDIKNWDLMSMSPGPGTIEISPNGNLYVFDKVNDRINIYDSEGNYLTKLTSKYISRFIITYFADIDDEGNIIALIPPDTIYKVDNKGELIFSTKEENHEGILSNDMILYKDQIFFYYEDETIRCVTNEGKVLSSYQTLSLIKEIDKGLVNDGKYYIKGLSDEMVKKIEDLKKSRKHIILGLISFDSIYPKSKSYYDLFDNSGFKSKEGIKYTLENLRGGDFIGFDRNFNNYVATIVNSKNIVIVVSPVGNILAVIHFGYSLDGFDYPCIAVAPNGDVYFLYSYEESVEIRRAVNVWDKIE